MFQTFDVASDRSKGPERLNVLRSALGDLGVDGFLVPRADVHQGEYVAPCDARLHWLTGFSGSAGFCAILPEVAGVFVDGRYRVQVRAEVADVFTPIDWPEVSLPDWLKQQVPNGGKIGFDPWLHTVSEIEKLTEALRDTAITLVPISNPVDQVWPDQPAPPAAPYRVQPIEFSGESHAAKCERLAKAMKAHHAVITLPDSIAWLLNIRGSDIARNPVPHALAILARDGTVQLFARPGQADPVIEHLGDRVQIADWDGFADAVSGLAGIVQIDPASCPIAVKDLIAPEQLQRAKDPCSLPKACKNETEIAGARAAHQRDAVAMVNFLAWLDAEGPKGMLTEVDVVTQLESFRRSSNALRDISFDTIAGAGPNGAIVHYRVDETTNRAVRPGELLLVDSGGQYDDGTTDITRTISIGTPTAEHRSCYTQVLRGMIAVSTARFPKGVGGQHLDALARTPLWQAGRDYDHGTGHGVGSYLCVHEGPQGLSRRSNVALSPGMILSNEPGYYRVGAFGIRIENLIVTIPAPDLPTADAREMYAFETLTYVPFDRRLIDSEHLTRAERDWINHYHAGTLSRLADHVEGQTKDWLVAACAPL
ncbi:MAG: aminopeptidase P family protein [Pseudomonadota bacterium]